MRPLTFDLVGEGHLPTVRVSAPTLRSRAGLPLLLFHRLLVGRTQTLQLVLTNEGALQSQVGSSSCVFTSLLDVLLTAFCLLVTYATAGSAGVYYAWLLVEKNSYFALQYSLTWNFYCYFQQKLLYVLVA